MRSSPRVVLVRVIISTFAAWVLLNLVFVITPAGERQMFQNVSGFHDRLLLRSWAPQRPFRGSDRSEVWLDQELNLCVIITGAKAKPYRNAESPAVNHHEFGSLTSLFFRGSKDEIRVGFTDRNSILILGSGGIFRVPLVGSAGVARALDGVATATGDMDLAAFLVAVKMDDPNVLHAIAESDRE